MVGIKCLNEKQVYGDSDRSIKWEVGEKNLEVKS